MDSIRARTLSPSSSFLVRSLGLSGSLCPSAHWPSPRGRFPAPAATERAESVRCPDDARFPAESAGSAGCGAGAGVAGVSVAGIGGVLLRTKWGHAGNPLIRRSADGDVRQIRRAGAQTNGYAQTQQAGQMALRT